MRSILVLLLTSWVFCRTNSQSSEIANILKSEFLLEGELEDIQWVGDNANVVMVLSDSNQVYRSGDEGMRFESQNNALDQLITDGRTNEPLKITSILQSKADLNRIFLIGEGIHSFVTTNAGMSWSLVKSARPFTEVVLHPKDPNAILAADMTPKCDDKKAEGKCYRTLYISRDFGQNWKELTTYVAQFDWLHQAGRGAADGEPLHAILASKYDKDSQEKDQVFGFWNHQIHFYVSTDDFKTEKLLVEGGNRFLFTDKFVFVAQVLKKFKGEVLLKMSDDGCRTFNDGKMPFKLKQHSYTVLDTSEDSVFLHVNHKYDGSHYGHVYISDAVGMNYSLSLPHNRRDVNGKCDFEKMAGVEGIYIANYIDNVDEIEKWSALQSTRTKSSNDPKQRHKKESKPKEKVRTVITFDKGGEWTYLKAPEVDAKGAPVRCSASDCSLHLHGVADEYGPFYSSGSAIGLIMATGNVGQSLSTVPGDVNTYFSRDAGLTWYEVSKGSRIYEFGDHGGLIVMADDTAETTKLQFSWTEFESTDSRPSFEEFDFTSSPMLVDNIIVEPTSTSRRLIVYGSRKMANGDEQGVMVAVDFTNFHARECAGLVSAGSESSDYEIWSPSDGRISGGRKCLLGHTIEYTRRKRGSACYNPVRHESKVTVSNCACMESDYECDFGFYRKTLDTQCVRDLSVDINSTKVVPQWCRSGGTYTISNGYRKIAGDTCEVVGGIDHMPTVYPCPTGVFGVSVSGWFVLFVILGLIVGMGMVTMKSKQLPYDVRAFGTKDFGDAVESAKSFTEQVKSFVRLVINRGQSDMGYTPVGAGGIPDSAMDYEDYDDGFGLDGSTADEAELLETSQDEEEEESEFKPLPMPSRKASLETTPTLAPPRQTSSVPLNLFGEDDELGGDVV